MRIKILEEGASADYWEGKVKSLELSELNFLAAEVCFIQFLRVNPLSLHLLKVIPKVCEPG